MARGTGPLFSLEATGSVGDALTYGKRGKANVIKRKAKPANPRTLAQIQSRAAIAAATAIWNSLSASDKALWTTEGDAKQITGFNAFTSAASNARAANLAPKRTPSGSPGPGLAIYDSNNIYLVKQGFVITLYWAIGPNESETTIIGLSQVSAADAQNPRNAVEIHYNTYDDESIQQITIPVNNIPSGTYYIGFMQGGQNGTIGDTQYLTDVVIP